MVTPDASKEHVSSWSIVCFAGVDWSSHRQRPQLLMASFAKQGHRVVYVDNLGVRMPRLRDAKRVWLRLANWLRSSRRLESEGPGDVQVLSPLVLPLHHWGLARRLARWSLSRRLRKWIPRDRPIVVWTYLPLPVVADVMDDLEADLLVYDWSDDAAEHVLTRRAGLRRRIARWEDEMASRADLLLLASAELLKRRRPSNSRTHVVPHGVKLADGAAHTLLPEVAKLPHPRVGFVGSISDWIDLDLLNRLSRERPQWTFVMVGPVKTNVGDLRKRANVVFTGERPHEEIPGLLSAFDSAIIPYRVMGATEVASPVKLREYLLHGLPVVSVDIPEVRSFSPTVRIASGHEEFLAALEEALRQGKRAPEPGMTPWSWDECAAEVSRLIECALSE